MKKCGWNFTQLDICGKYGEIYDPAESELGISEIWFHSQSEKWTVVYRYVLTKTACHIAIGELIGCWVVVALCLFVFCDYYFLPWYISIKHHLWNMCLCFTNHLKQLYVGMLSMLARSSYMLTGFFGSFDAVFFWFYSRPFQGWFF